MRHYVRRLICVLCVWCDILFLIALKSLSSFSLDLFFFLVKRLGIGGRRCVLHLRSRRCRDIYLAWIVGINETVAYVIHSLSTVELSLTLLLVLEYASVRRRLIVHVHILTFHFNKVYTHY